MSFFRWRINYTIIYVIYTVKSQWLFGGTTSNIQHTTVWIVFTIDCYWCAPNSKSIGITYIEEKSIHPSSIHGRIHIVCTHIQSHTRKEIIIIGNNNNNNHHHHTTGKKCALAIKISHFALAHLSRLLHFKVAAELKRECARAKDVDAVQVEKQTKIIN